MRKHIHRAYRQVCEMSPEVKRKVRIAYTTLIGIAILASIVIVLIAEIQVRRIEDAARQSATPPFPVGVDPSLKQIVENEEVDTYFAVYLSPRNTRPQKLSWFEKTLDHIAQSKWYQQLASPIARVVVIHPGERKEEVARNFGNILDWDETERAKFLELVGASSPDLVEGIYFPNRYLTHKDASPEEIALFVSTQFDDEVRTRYTSDVAAQIPFAQAMVLASLLEREAYDFTDMREISGIIWNRLFVDMNLQLDATLQYAKANGTEGPWWPRINPDDKYIDSPFNTYENEGLPPAPIANPSLDAILAALNPIETDCMFYFHDDYSNFHCSETYAGHVAKLRQFYGQGR